MRLESTPLGDRLFIPEKRQRQYFTGFRQTFESLDRYEAVDLIQLGAKTGRKFQVFVSPTFCRLYFEDYRDHILSFPPIPCRHPARGKRSYSVIPKRAIGENSIPPMRTLSELLDFLAHSLRSRNQQNDTGFLHPAIDRKRFRWLRQDSHPLRPLAISFSDQRGYQ
jgi:hypothetical protein